ncbi:hypothetical protein EJB05_48426, partial [Eragrostis curvula]
MKPLAVLPLHRNKRKQSTGNKPLVIVAHAISFNLSKGTNIFTYIEKKIGHLESIQEDGDAGHTFFPCAGNDDIAHRKESMPMQLSTESSVGNPSPENDDFTCPESPLESFVTDDGNSNMSEEEDDEYFAFVGNGIADVMAPSSFLYK